LTPGCSLVYYKYWRKSSYILLS